MACINLNVERASHQEAKAILTLLQEIRKDARFNCPVVMMVECAPGLAASHVERLIDEAHIRDVCIMSERGEQYRVGVPKTQAITFEYCVELQRVLIDGALRYASNIVSYDPNGEREGPELVEELKTRMERMMRNLRKEYSKNTRLDGTRSFVITAKPNDDMLIALQMVLYWRKKFWQNNKYSNWHRHIRGSSNVEFPF